MQVNVHIESWPIAGTFRIARGAKSEAKVVVVKVEDQGFVGFGECVPYARYGETEQSVAEMLQSLPEAALNVDAIQNHLPAGAARNAVDCALWDLAAKQTGKRVWELLGHSDPMPQECAYTLSLGSPEEMEQAARQNSNAPLLKIKLGADGDEERVAAVRRGAPAAKIIADANEGWTPDQYRKLIPRLAELEIAMIEQPLPAGEDEALASLPRPIPICADESCHDRGSLAKLAGRYDMINIKLDKTGGLTEALALKQAALAAGFEIMVGCMVGTSLAMAPALLVAQGAAIVDLDGPLLLARDRQASLTYQNGAVFPPDRACWG